MKLSVLILSTVLATSVALAPGTPAVASIGVCPTGVGLPFFSLPQTLHHGKVCDSATSCFPDGATLPCSNDVVASYQFGGVSSMEKTFVTQPGSDGVWNVRVAAPAARVGIVFALSVPNTVPGFGNGGIGGVSVCLTNTLPSNATASVNGVGTGNFCGGAPVATSGTPRLATSDDFAVNGVKPAPFALLNPDNAAEPPENTTVCCDFPQAPIESLRAGVFTAQHVTAAGSNAVSPCTSSGVVRGSAAEQRYGCANCLFCGERRRVGVASGVLGDVAFNSESGTLGVNLACDSTDVHVGESKYLVLGLSRSFSGEDVPLDETVVVKVTCDYTPTAHVPQPPVAEGVVVTALAACAAVPCVEGLAADAEEYTDVEYRIVCHTCSEPGLVAPQVVTDDCKFGDEECCHRVLEAAACRAGGVTWTSCTCPGVDHFHCPAGCPPTQAPAWGLLTLVVLVGFLLVCGVALCAKTPKANPPAIVSGHDERSSHFVH